MQLRKVYFLMTPNNQYYDGLGTSRTTSMFKSAKLFATSQAALSDEDIPEGTPFEVKSAYVRVPEEKPKLDTPKTEAATSGGAPPTQQRLICPPDTGAPKPPFGSNYRGTGSGAKDGGGHMMH